MSLKELQKEARKKNIDDWYKLSKEELKERLNLIKENIKKAPAIVKTKLFDRFIRIIKICENSSSYYFFIKESFESEYPEEIWSDELSLYAVEIRLSYHFLIKDYKESKVACSDRLRERYEDSKKYKITKVNQIVKQCREDNQTKGEGKMKTKAKKAEKKDTKKKAVKKSEVSVSALRKKTREKGIKGWYALEVDELKKVLDSKATKASIEKITLAARKRYAEANKKYQK